MPAAKESYSSADTRKCLPSLVVWVIGGKLRTETQALVPPLVKTGDTNAETTTSKVIESFLEAIGGASQGVIALMGATAVASDGFRTNTEQEKNIKREMINSAAKVVFLVDHSKFLEDGRFTFMGFEDAQELVSRQHKTIVVLTDRRPPRPIAESLEDAGIELRVVAGDFQLAHTPVLGDMTRAEGA